MEVEDNKAFEDSIFGKSFQEFVDGENEQAIKYCEGWLVKHLDKDEEFIKAIQVIKPLRNTRKLPVEIDKQQVFINLLQRIEKQQIKPVAITRRLSLYMLRVASIILFTLFISSVCIWFLSRKGTDYLSLCNVIVTIGEKSKIIPDDEPHVWINSGSRLKYPSKFGSKLRDVYLESVIGCLYQGLKFYRLIINRNKILDANDLQNKMTFYLT